MTLRRCILSLVVCFSFASAPASHAATPTSVTVSWTTPGDDGLSGTASQFDLRYSTSAITSSNFSSATRWTPMPLPGASGSNQSVTVTGLASNTTYYFAIKTGDDVSNWSGISNIASYTTPIAPDTVRPAPLALSVSSVTDTSVSVIWTAVGDDSLTGTASSYDLRYSTSPITSANWGSATAVSGLPSPASPGTAQGYAVKNLSREVTYYFAMRTTDDAGNTSALSNVPSVTTPDTTPPATVQNLSVNFVWISWASEALPPARLRVVRR